MNRRLFLSTATLFAASTLVKPNTSQAVTGIEACVPDLDYVSAEATYFARYEHYHLLSVPVSALIQPPVEGFKTRTTTLDQGSLDEVAFKQFIAESGLPEQALRHHSHEVNFTQSELARIASGEANVEITVLTPKGNLGHKFYFTASKSSLAKIKRARGLK